MYFDFEGDSGSLINDKSYSGKNDGYIVNTATSDRVEPENSFITFNSNDDDYVKIYNSVDINDGTFSQRTISIKFKVNNKNIASRKQVIYEEGGRGSGLNIYVFDGRLYVGGWNNQSWPGTFLSTDRIASGQWYNVSLVLDAQAETFSAYLDGVKFGKGQGLQLTPHLGGIGLGNVNIDTKFHDGTFQGTGNHGLEGSLDEVLLHNRALPAAEIAAFSTPPPMYALGTNLAAIKDWSTQLPFIDGFKSSRPWIPQNSTTWDTREYEVLDVDENGWVKSLPSNNGEQRYQYVSTLLYREIQGQYPGGRYVVLYDGQGRLSYGMDATLVESGQGRDVIQVTPSHNGILLSIKETDPDHEGDYLRNIRVIPSAQEKNYTSNFFNSAFIDKINPFQSLRFMDWMVTNNSTQKEWEDRPTLETASWSKTGVPVEIMVALANQTDADPWFTIPHQATDEYVLNFAEYVKNNLEPERKVYVEYSNEVWNPQFQQYQWVQQQAKLTPNQTPGVTEWYSRRTTQITQIWDRVFGADKQRVIGVMGAQAANPWIAERELSYSWTASPQSHQDYGIDAIAIAPYFGGEKYLLDTPEKVARVKGWAQDAQSGLDSLFDELLTGASSGQSAIEFVADLINPHKAIAEQNGLQLLAYEGGQHLVNSSDTSMNDLFMRANRDPRMGELYEQYLSQWYQLGGGLFEHFNDISAPNRWGSWGTLDTVYQTTSPKYEALMQFLASS